VVGKSTILLSGALLTVGAGVLGFSWRFERPSESLHLPGVVETQEVRLGSKLGGRVESVSVAEGDVVEAGQILARFEAPELQAQKQQLQARLQVAEAELDRARNGPRSEEIAAARAAVEEARASLDRLKAGSRPEEIRRAKGDLDSAEVDRRLARQELDRVERLYPLAAVSRADYDSACAALGRAVGRVTAARAHLDLLKAGSRAEDIAEAAAQLRRAEANLQLLTAGTRSEDITAASARVAEIRGKLAEVEANLAEAIVRAPERSVVEVLSVRKGDLVAANQPIVRILRTEDLWVKVYVAETDLGKIRVDDPVEVTVDSHPGRRFPGVIRQIASQSEFTPRNVQSIDERHHQVFGVKVHVTNPDGIFKSGMAAEVHVKALSF
jgi:HlyD family secretion protein